MTKTGVRGMRFPEILEMFLRVTPFCQRTVQTLSKIFSLESPKNCGKCLSKCAYLGPILGPNMAQLLFWMIDD